MSNLVPYLGGKQRAARTIISRLPAHTCYCEVFAGGAGVFFAKDPSDSEILNDRDKDLVTLYRVVKLHPDELFRQFRFSLASRAEFERQLAENPDSLTDIQRAARYLYLQQSCYGGRCNNRTWSANTSGVGNMSLLNMQHVIEEAWMRLAHAQIECMDFREFIPRYDREYTCFYADPPYWGLPYYNYNFVERDFVDLARLLAGIKGGFVMSINDTPEIREIFGAFTIEEIRFKYTAGARTAGSADILRTELLISNKPPAKHQHSLFD